MKSFAFAALAAIVTAQTTEGPETDFPEATYGFIKSSGSINETQTITETGENTIYLNAIWTNTIDEGNFPGSALVQNYVQWSSFTEAGKYQAVVCSIQYAKSNGTGAGPQVVNLDNTDSIAISDKNFDGSYWNEIGTPGSRAEKELFTKETDPAKTAEYYGRQYQKNSFSSQNCGTSAMIYIQENGEDVEGLEEVNELYWQLKNAGDVTLWSGFRIWEKPTDRNVWAAKDHGQTTWQAHDWGMEDPNAVVIVPDEEETTDAESGAAALMAAATTLIAFLMF